MQKIADPQRSALEAWQMLSGILQAAQMIPAAQRAAAGSLPLTVIGGFLGAGKTTLLNRLLAEPHGRRIAVLINDFGRINIDAALIRSRTEDTISLANGCACCSVAGDLTKTLIELAQRLEPPDAIVLEASGLADPRGIAQVALANPALRLDGVLAVLDAETLHGRSQDPACRDTFLAQLSAADLIVLNKLDLLDENARDAARDWLNLHAPARPVVETVQADVPIEVVLGIHTEREPPRGAVPGHASAFRSWSITCDTLLDAGKVRAMMDGIPAAILRAKGILWLSDAPDQRTVYQRVGPRWSYTAAGRWNAGKPESSLVLIGPVGMLDATQWCDRLRECQV